MLSSLKFMTLTLLSVNAFVQQPTANPETALHGSRRAFVEAALGTAFVAAAPVLALDDLDMPSAEDEARAEDVSVVCWKCTCHPLYNSTLAGVAQFLHLCVLHLHIGGRLYGHEAEPFLIS